MRRFSFMLVVFFSLFTCSMLLMMGPNAALAAEEGVLKQDPVKSPSIITSPSNGKEEGFTVQVYSFRDPERAAKALRGLKEAGYQAFQEVSEIKDRGTFYRVRIGPLVTEAEAMKVLGEVKQKFQDGFIVNH